MKLEGSMSTKTRRQYTEEFKTEAVRLVRDSARPVAQVARDLGIADHLLYRWRVSSSRRRSVERRGRTSELKRPNWSDCGARMLS
ncbi:MAG: transposase [Nitrospira sp.]|nr:transposase [Nitrospira sp.]